MDFTININAPAIAESINKLAEVISTALSTIGTSVNQNVPTVQQQIPQNTPVQQPQKQTTVNTPPVSNAMQTAAQPFQTVPQTVEPPVVQPAVQQTAPAVIDGDYQNRICNAAARLLEQNKMQDVLALLSSFGVAAITQLSPEQLPEFAKGLTALGAVI